MKLIINTSVCPHIILYGKNVKKIVSLPDGISTCETLLPKIEKVLQSQKISFKNLYAICVCNGPGSFTGTRIALATTFAINYGAKIPIVKFNLFDLFEKNCIIKASGGGFYVKKDDRKFFAKSFEDYENFESFDFDKLTKNKIDIFEKEILVCDKLYKEKAFCKTSNCAPLYMQNSQAENMILDKIEIRQFNKEEARRIELVGDVFVAIYKSEVVGKLSLEKNKGSYKITHISVVENFRKMGVATKLILHAKKVLGENTFFASCNKTNESAINLYSKLGSILNVNENEVTFRLD